MGVELSGLVTLNSDGNLGFELHVRFSNVFKDIFKNYSFLRMHSIPVLNNLLCSLFIVYASIIIRVFTVLLVILNA